MDILDAYTIPFTGLSEGIHHFDFRLDGAFFTAFGNEELAEADFQVNLEMVKETSFMELNIDYDGSFTTVCDRCLGQLLLPLSGERHLIAKVHAPTDDEEILALQAQDTKLDLARSFYESIVADLPLKRAHEEEDCDPEVLERLDSFGIKSEETSDPRWDALRKLKGGETPK